MRRKKNPIMNDLFNRRQIEYVLLITIYFLTSYYLPLAVMHASRSSFDSNTPAQRVKFIKVSLNNIVIDDVVAREKN